MTATKTKTMSSRRVLLLLPLLLALVLSSCPAAPGCVALSLASSSSSLAPPSSSAFLAGVGGLRTRTPAGSSSSSSAIGGIGLMMVRGGADYSEAETEYGEDEDEDEDENGSEYDSSSDEETEEAYDSSDGDSDGDVYETEPYDSDADAGTDTTIDSQSPANVERLQLSAQLSSRARNLGIATALWSSLFFDSILNNAKRSDLFPSSAATAAAASAAGGASSLSPMIIANLVPTVLLASGFGLASCVAFLLWRDLDVRADMLSSDNGKESFKGDHFLSLSNLPNAEFASRTRARLLFHSTLFGLLSLGAHSGLAYSTAAPFLGASAAIINVHNALACGTALLAKDDDDEEEDGGASSSSGIVGRIAAGSKKLFKNNEGKKDGMAPTLTPLLAYRAFSIAAWIKCVPACGEILLLARGLSTATTSAAGAAAATGAMAPMPAAAVADGARRLSLRIASLARLTLVAGASRALRDASAETSSARDHPFFAVLGGVLGAGCLGVGGAALFAFFASTMRSVSTSSGGLPAAMAATAPLIEATALVAFGAFFLYRSISVVALMAEGRSKSGTVSS